MSDQHPLLHQFDGFEKFIESLYGYDIEVQQLDNGFFTATSQQIVSGNILVSNLMTTRCIEVKGNPPPKLRTFGIPDEKCLPFIWRNQHSDGNTIQIYRDTTEMEMVTQPFFSAIDLSIPEDTLNQQCQTLGLPELDTLLGDNEMLTCKPDSMRRLRNALRRVCLILGADPSLISTKGIQQEIECELPLLLLNALSSAEQQQGLASPGKRHSTLKKAVDYIKEFSNTPITLNNLCDETQVSARTLQHAFTDHFGMTPKAYLRVQRLNNARKQLFSSMPDNDQVTDIAYRNGFNHMGQFSADYYKLFGELPSETLKNHRRPGRSDIFHTYRYL
ncbi:MAG: helix-turn-helix transcriptional regulator [Pseudomonadales bacterium]|nr:helix-turn-helix transcriptional regulator [Pseudomonadales bacterium]